MSRPNSLRQALAGLSRFARVFWPHVRGQWRLIAAGSAGLLTGTLMRILEPWPLKFVIDHLTGHDADRARVSLAWVERLGTDELFLGAALALVLVAGLRAGRP